MSYVPAKPVRLNRELLRYRASLVKIQTGIKNRIHTILAKNNISHDYTDLFGKAGMAFLHSLSLPENYKIALEGYLCVLETVRHEVRGDLQAIRQRLPTGAAVPVNTPVATTILFLGPRGSILGSSSS